MPEKGPGINSTKCILSISLIEVVWKKLSEFLWIFLFSRCLHSNWFLFKETLVVKRQLGRTVTTWHHWVMTMDDADAPDRACGHRVYKIVKRCVECCRVCWVFEIGNFLNFRWEMHCTKEDFMRIAFSVFLHKY